VVQAFAQNRMRQIGPGFIRARDGVFMSSRYQVSPRQRPNLARNLGAMNQPMIDAMRMLATPEAGNQYAASAISAGTDVIATAALPNSTTAIIIASNVAI
jgi:hypothetical protein